MARKVSRRSIVEIPPGRSDSVVMPLLPAEVSRGVEIRPVLPEEIDQCMSLFFRNAPGDDRQIYPRTESFKQLARRENYDLNYQMVATVNGQIRHACLFVPQPGRMAFLFTSWADQTSPTDWDIASKTVAQTCNWAFRQGSNLIQVLIEMTDRYRRELCLKSDFHCLTDLIYMHYPAIAPRQMSPLSDDYHWLTYEPAHRDLFKQVINQTYRDSLDCPELTQLRNMDDVIDSHKTAGLFEPRWWKILLHQKTPAAVLLLNPLKSSGVLELTYMGLVPSFRGRGLSKLVLEEALRCVPLSNRTNLTLAVDCRNKPACQLYLNFGFEVIFRRTALIKPSNWPK